MGKVNLLVKYCLRNEKLEYNIKGILRDQKLIYKDVENIMILDLNLNILERKTKNGEIVFDFSNKICSITEEGYKADFKILVIKLISKKNFFYVKYKIENDYFELEIKLI